MCPQLAPREFTRSPFTHRSHFVVSAFHTFTFFVHTTFYAILVCTSFRYPIIHTPLILRNPTLYAHHTTLAVLHNVAPHLAIGTSYFLVISQQSYSICRNANRINALCNANPHCVICAWSSELFKHLSQQSYSN